jgi:hypothetical protein
MKRNRPVMGKKLCIIGRSHWIIKDLRHHVKHLSKSLTPSIRLYDWNISRTATKLINLVSGNITHIYRRLHRSRYSNSLRAGRPGDPMPVEARFSAPVQTGTGIHPASYTNCIRSFPGIKRQRRGVNHPPLSSAEVKEKAELYFYSLSVPL